MNNLRNQIEARFLIDGKCDECGIVWGTTAHNEIECPIPAVLNIIDDHMKEDAEREEEIFLRNQDAIWAGERDDPA